MSAGSVITSVSHRLSWPCGIAEPLCHRKPRSQWLRTFSRDQHNYVCDGLSLALIVVINTPKKRCVLQLRYDILDCSRSPMATTSDIFYEKGKGQLSSSDNICDGTHLWLHRLFILRALGFGLWFFVFCFTKCAWLKDPPVLT